MFRKAETCDFFGLYIAWVMEIRCLLQNIQVNCQGNVNVSLISNQYCIYQLVLCLKRWCHFMNFSGQPSGNHLCYELMNWNLVFHWIHDVLFLVIWHRWLSFVLLIYWSIIFKSRKHKAEFSTCAFKLLLLGRTSCYASLCWSCKIIKIEEIFTTALWCRLKMFHYVSCSSFLCSSCALIMSCFYKN